MFQETIWIGPVQFHKSDCKTGASKLVQVLNQLSKRNCNITVIGNVACKAVASESSSILVFNMIFNASVVWEFFKGRKLPAVTALDRVSFMHLCNIHLFYSKFKRELKQACGIERGLDLSPIECFCTS